MSPAVAASYRHCRRVARTRARNFYYSFLLLSRAQKDAMCAIYAFMRFCDDLSDEQGGSRAAIERWRAELDEALAGRLPPNPLWPKSPTQLAPEMKAPVLGLYGEADTGIPVATVEALKTALAEAKKTAEFKIYPAAPHGFHADYRASYRKEAAEDGWNQMQAWFKKYKVLS